MVARLARGVPARGLRFKGGLVRPWAGGGQGGRVMAARRFAALMIATALTVGTATFALARTGIGITVTPSQASPQSIRLTH